ncbi:Transposable element Tcb1 transposase Transposable element Barney transposase [Larimichthys crocea]|uniref:Transposable element Tcb1 transposase Transposable element Barney transposase n=1 Tax=Larimichthys crocea TaxID=215358 RepID=A0A6G0J0V2_LARCR|nr:Transposable element Tcb1 transposase Transposable element Barney transposase [Larimichthys crocea]
MGKNKDLSDFDKGQIVVARRLGHSISKTAALVGCSRSAVVSIYQQWSKEGTAVNRRQGHGRPRLIDARGERKLARVVQSNRQATVAQIAEKVNAGSDRKVSEHTVHRSLLRMGLRCHRPIRVPMLTPIHCQKRQQWALKHQHWTAEQWKKVAWSDVRRLPGKHMAQAGGGGSVMLWAMFCWETLGPVIHVDVTLTPTTYLNIVTDHVHPFMETVFPDGSGLFQQENAPYHKAKVVQEWFEEHNNEFEVLTWPPNSPDLNPMGDLWDALDKQVRSMEAPPQDLKDLLQTSWCQIPQHTFRGLVESMPQRVSAVLAAEGGPTKDM